MSAPALRLFVLLTALTAACPSPRPKESAAESGPFDEFFRLGGTTKLEEAAEDPIGDIAILVECRDSDLLVGDRIKLQVRRYNSEGRLLATFGGYGEGPFEFRRIGGLLEDGAGRVVVTDPQLGRVTILTRELRPDTSFLVRPTPRGAALPMDDAVLLASATGPRASAFTLMDAHWKPVWSIPAPTPGTMERFPYWDSFASVLVSATPEVVLTAYSLRYPIYVYTRSGALLDSLTSAPRSFRTAPVLARGAFAGPDGSRRREKWLASFDIMSSLAIVNDSLLVVVHGVLRRTATSRVVSEDQRLDVYHLRSRSKLAEDIPLPDGVRVLSGGHALYLLTAQPPEAWQVQRADFIRAPARSRGSRR